MKCKTSPSYSLTVQLSIENRIGMFAKIATAISKAGGDLGPIAILKISKDNCLKTLLCQAFFKERS